MYAILQNPVLTRSLFERLAQIEYDQVNHLPQSTTIRTRHLVPIRESSKTFNREKCVSNKGNLFGRRRKNKVNLVNFIRAAWPGAVWGKGRSQLSLNKRRPQSKQRCLPPAALRMLLNVYRCGELRASSGELCPGRSTQIQDN